MRNIPSKSSTQFEFKGELNFINGPVKPKFWGRVHNWMSEPNPEGVTGYDMLFIFTFFGAVLALLFGAVYLAGIV